MSSAAPLGWAFLVCAKGGCAAMMGMKERNFSLLPDLSLDELVHEDNFYRRSVPVVWPAL